MFSTAEEDREEEEIIKTKVNFKPQKKEKNNRGKIKEGNNAAFTKIGAGIL